MGQEIVKDLRVFQETCNAISRNTSLIQEACNRSISEANRKQEETQEELAYSKQLLEKAIIEEQRCQMEVQAREAEVSAAAAGLPETAAWYADAQRRLAIALAEYEKAVAHRILMERRVALAKQCVFVASEMVSTLITKYNYSKHQISHYSEVGISRLNKADRYTSGYIDDKPSSNKRSDIEDYSKGNKLQHQKKIVKSYTDEMKDLSPCPETLGDAKNFGELVYTPPEIVKEKRCGFNSSRNKLIREWEQKHHRNWPTYANDVFDKNGNVVRCKGDFLEAHHVKPLAVGGENNVFNITPMHYDVHNDRQGIHAPNGNFSKMCEMVKEDH